MLIAMAGWGIAAAVLPPARAAGVSPAADSVPATQAADAHDFDLPAQPLHEALQRYSQLTGRSVLYEAGVVAQRRSAPVAGHMPADEALRRLLAGSGVSIGYATGQVYTLLPQPQAAAARPSSAVLDDAARLNYYGRLQARVLRALCADPLIDAGGYRLALRFRIDNRPAIERLLVAAVDRSELEPRIRAALLGLPVLAPPPGLGQPITMLLTPDAARAQGGCKGAL